MIAAASEYSSLWGDIILLLGLLAFAIMNAYFGFCFGRGRILSGQHSIPRGETYVVINESVDDDRWPDVPSRRIFIIRDKSGELRAFWLNPGEELRRFIFVDGENGQRLLVPKDPRDVLIANSIPYL